MNDSTTLAQHAQISPLLPSSLVVRGAPTNTKEFRSHGLILGEIGIPGTTRAARLLWPTRSSCPSSLPSCYSTWLRRIAANLHSRRSSPRCNRTVAYFATYGQVIAAWLLQFVCGLFRNSHGPLIQNPRRSSRRDLTFCKSIGIFRSGAFDTAGLQGSVCTGNHPHACLRL